MNRTPSGVRLAVLPLEDRVTPATITWNNPAGGSWNTGENWDLNRVPTAADDVVIPDVGAAEPSVTITFSGNATANSLTTRENVASRDFTLAGNLAINGGPRSPSAATSSSSTPTRPQPTIR